ncbi:interleukin-12 receptor subunit beta-1 [Pseudonaja textilis]|uniref:interleukin-12 receptor subunit beta-1 n=1 Tax=Pseudonaja textilis TaxID=8673 RepID=UPI000EA9C177|nr:interleukin-12 receptor subunit beta-1 [Pseudonaja textilis]
MVPVVVAVLVMVRLAASELLSDPSNCTPQNLICYKPCCEAAFLCLMNCSWEAGCKEDVNHILHLRDQTEGEIQPFEAGNQTHFIFNTDTVYARRNFTVWVESMLRDGPSWISKNHTLLIKESIKFNPPSANSISISRSKGILTLKWPGSRTCRSTLNEVRMRQFNHLNWTLGNCSSDDTTKGLIVATCHLEKNIRYEVQVRYRTDHWSSHWSSWSEILFVPCEILRSPTVNYTVGSLGKEGERNVTLQWARPSVEQGVVNYTLSFVMLACKPCSFGLEKYNITVDNATSYHTSLSAAEYNISLVAINHAGRSPAYSFKLPPEQNAGASFLNVSLSGRRYTLEWKVDEAHFCFEAEPLGETLPKKDCMKPDATYLFTGEMESNRCYRFAVYKYVIKWKTVGYTYLFHRNASLEDAIRINVTNQTANSAVIQWKPPRALSDCPGVLKKYIICCQKEQYGNLTYYDVNVSQTWYTIQNLQPDTVYLVGIWVSTANSKDNCKAFYRFLTKAPGITSLPPDFLFMGIFGGILVVIIIFYLGKKRMKKSLFPALPDPANTEAVKFHTTAKTGQAQVKLNFMEPMEVNSTMEPLVVEPSSDKEEPVTDTTMNFLGFVKGTEEEHSPKEDEVVCDEILLSEYEGQRFLSPVEESEDFIGVSHEENTCDGPHLLLNNTEAGDQNGICMSQVPLSFKLFDKLVVIKNVGEGFDIPCSDGTST